MSNNTILDQLYEKYFQSPDIHVSSVTSSHWKIVGKQEVTRSTDGSFALNGLGFGHRKDSSLVSQLCHFPELIMVKQLMTQFSDYSMAESFGREIAKKQSFMFGYDCARQVLAASYLRMVLKQVTVNRVCIIGDGYGYMGGLLKSLWPDVQIIEVNLGRTLLFDVAYIQKAFPDASMSLLTNSSDIETKSSSTDFIFLEAEYYERLKGQSIDLFINIASMQEMNLDIVNHYLSLMRTSSVSKPYFYCCNRVEKQLPDGELVRFEKYGWSEGDEVLDDELCPWYQQYPASLPPFWRPFDGPIHHRLVKLAK